MGKHSQSKNTKQQMRFELSSAHPKVLFADKQPLYTKDGTMTKYVGYVNEEKVKGNAS